MYQPLALQNATNKEVNLILAALKELPIKPATVASQLGMPGVALEKTELQQLEATTRAGRYFIIDPFDDAEKFVKVDKP